jgi:hypothetical protein
MLPQAKESILINEENFENWGKFEVKRLYFRNFIRGKSVEDAEVDLNIWPNNIDHLMVSIIDHFWG